MLSWNTTVLKLTMLQLLIGSDAKINFFPERHRKICSEQLWLYLKSNHCVLFTQVRVKALGKRLGINLVFA